MAEPRDDDVGASVPVEGRSGVFAGAPGELIGPYRLVGRLGAGAMGDVWSARDERLDRLVAIKLVTADRADDVEHRARMVREARAAAAVPHPNVVTLFDILSDGDRDVLVMELVEGRTLAEVVRSGGPVPLADALRWLEAIADALATAHGKGILHRDMKTANVMVTVRREVKVLDFGLAKLRGVDDGVKSTSGGGAPRPRSVSAERIAMDETMPSELPGAATRPEQRTATGSALGPGSRHDAYTTRAGALLGTPMYMAPEQIAGSPCDERTEVFSVGVIAYEMLAGQSPYSAASMEELFAQIANKSPPKLDKLPAEVGALVERALAKDPSARFPSMSALRDAVAALRGTLFARRRRWPIAVAIAAAVAATAVVVYVATREEHPVDRPGDAYVRRALEDYDVFYTDRALSSLRAALKLAPDHPRASAYMILFGAPPADRAAAAAAANRAIAAAPAKSKDRALLDAALALEARGPKAARAALRAAGATVDRELAFWSAELAYRSADYGAAGDEFRALLADPAARFRGRIYDHFSSVLLYRDEPALAEQIGTLYRDAFPGEADAVAVHATTLAAAGRLDEALAAAEYALQLAEGEDTLAGLGKVRALRGELDLARDLYRRSMERAGPARRPIRRAALAMLQWVGGDVAGARETVAPCLPSPARQADPAVASTSTDADAPERGACLFVAGAVDLAVTDVAIAELERLADAATDLAPAYGAPDRLAALLRVRKTFFAGACVVPSTPGVAPANPAELDAVLAGPTDFYASYHVPFFATWAVCERAALAAASGDRAAARALLQPVAERAPGRTWLLDDLASYR